jgi:hypothetical protein
MYTRNSNKISTVGAIVGLIVVMGCAGCSMQGDPGAPSPPPPVPPTLDGKIQAINQSNMSAQNKAIAISLVKAQAARSSSSKSTVTAPPQGG